MISAFVAAGQPDPNSVLPNQVNVGDVEAFRDLLLRLRGDKRELVLIVFEQLIKARLFKRTTALSRALDAMLIAVGSWEEPRTTQDHDAMEAIFELIYKARPLRQEGAYRRHMVQRNQKLGDRRSRVTRPQFLEAVQRYQGMLNTDAEIATAIAREFKYPEPQTGGREAVERRIRRLRVGGYLPKRRGCVRSSKKAR